MNDEYELAPGNFEDERRKTESALMSISNFPHPQGLTTPMLGPDAFPQWFSPPYVFLFYIMAEIGAGFVVAFFFTAATYQFPGGFVGNLFFRCAIIAGVHYFVTLAWSKWTGATMDVWNCWLVGFCEMFFSRRGRPMSPSGFLTRFSVLGKMIVFPLCQLLGTLVGVSAWSLVVDFPVRTSDCSVDYAVSCSVRPTAVAVSDRSASWAIFWGHMLLYGAQFIGWVWNKKITIWVAPITKRFARAVITEEHTHESGHYVENSASMARVKPDLEERIPWEINDEWGDLAKLCGSAMFLTQGVFSVFVGTGFNFWFWFVTSIFTNDYSQANLYAWPGLAAGVVVFLIALIYFLLSSGSAAYTSAALRTKKEM